MQKVVGSSPIIRFTKPRKSGLFCVLGLIGYHRLYARKLTFSLTSGTRYRLRMAKRSGSEPAVTFDRPDSGPRAGKDAMRNRLSPSRCECSPGRWASSRRSSARTAEAVSDGASTPRRRILERRMDSLVEQAADIAAEQREALEYQQSRASRLRGRDTSPSQPSADPCFMCHNRLRCERILLVIWRHDPLPSECEMKILSPACVDRTVPAFAVSLTTVAVSCAARRLRFHSREPVARG